jgi:FkbM family methyltransferase
MSRMRSKNSISILTATYQLARNAGFLEWRWFRRSYVAAYFFYKQFYEDSFLNLVRRTPELFRNGDILDIGANIGYTACVFAGALTPGSKVYAFEPDRSSHALLEDIIQRKKLTASVEALNLAVGSCDSTVEFWHNEAHSADHRVVTERLRAVRSDLIQTTTVSMTSVDAFVKDRKVRNVSFIKIDVQGYELAVSEGMRCTLEKFPAAAVCIEYSPESLLELGFVPEKVLDFFRVRGYGIYVLTRAGIQPAATNSVVEGFVENAGYVDLICSKQALVS